MSHKITNVAPRSNPIDFSLPLPTAIPRGTAILGASQVDAFEGAKGSKLFTAPRPTITRVDDFLGRGKQPGKKEYLGLAQEGYRMVIDLRQTGTSKEKSAVEGAGMKFVNLPVKNGKAPTDAQVRQFLDLMSQPENQPAFIHCAHGKGRTGVFCAAYRMAFPDPTKLDEVTGKPRVWTLEEALAEGKANGLSEGGGFLGFGASKDQVPYLRGLADRMAKGEGIWQGYPTAEPLQAAPVLVAPELPPNPDLVISDAPTVSASTFRTISA